jgi:hypothetical protein
MDPTSRRSHAVSISVVTFHQLDDAVRERWLRESCPGTHLEGDEEDRKRKTELLVFDDPLVPKLNEPKWLRYLRMPGGSINEKSKQKHH